MKNKLEDNREKIINPTIINPIKEELGDIKEATGDINDEKLEENRSKFQKDDIKSLFCYGDVDIKKMIWSLKTDPKFYKSLEGANLMKAISKEIFPHHETHFNTSQVCQNHHNSNIIIICAPSSSFWQSKKNFDHMHVFIKKFVKKLKRDGSKGGVKEAKFNNFDGNITYLPHAIIPYLNKKPQKGLNKQERQNQSMGAYGLSNYFKYHLRQKLLEKTTFSNAKNGLFHTADHNAVHSADEILILDDVKTTGATLIECKNTIERYININGLSLENKDLKIRCLSLAYEA